jgi:hypothetical protein
MGKTPSKRRQEGREAFYPGGDPEQECPYYRGSWGYDIYYSDFLDGWKQAEAESKAEAAEKEAQQEKEREVVKESYFLLEIHTTIKSGNRENFDDIVETVLVLAEDLSSAEKKARDHILSKYKLSPHRIATITILNRTIS